DRPGGHQRLGRAAPAPRHRPRPGEEALRLPVRRLVLGPRRRYRRAPAARPGARDAGRRRADRGATRGHHRRRRPHRGARGRPRGGQGHPRGAARHLAHLPGDRRVAAAGGGMSARERTPGAGARPASGGAPKVMQQTERVRAPGGPHGGGMVGQKATNFGPSVRRLLGLLAPQRVRVVFLLVAGVLGVALAAIGPRVLGRATDLIFAGVIGKLFPAGITREEAIAGARAAGQGQIADMLMGVDLVPGQGVDFGAVGEVLLIVMLIYVGSSLLQYLQGYLLNDVVQSTVFGMRQAVEEKLNRLPLAYFDRQPRGELLSRVTNDIDNVSQSLQQTMSQLLSSLLTVVFVLIMMVSISPVLT